MTRITIQTKINAPLETVWNAWINPADIILWNAASEDWHTTHAENDFRVGGLFNYRMEAKDGSFGFDLKGTYTDIHAHIAIHYHLEDHRKVSVFFSHENGQTEVIQSFEPETENAHDLQQAGWQAILNNFKLHVEGKKG